MLFKKRFKKNSLKKFGGFEKIITYLCLEKIYKHLTTCFAKTHIQKE